LVPLTFLDVFGVVGYVAIARLSAELYAVEAVKVVVNPFRKCARESPEVEVAMNETPASTLLYTTPVIVAVCVPAKITPVVTPDKAPVPE
jgi:hypothetical protein